jgi:hypothetical protein
MPARGSYNFEVDKDSKLVDSPANLHKLGDLFRDGAIISGNWGPGDEGDFDHGSWHVLCHLVGGSGVLNTALGRAWCGLAHEPVNDSYQAAIVFRRNGIATTAPLKSVEGAALTRDAQCLGFIEGSSRGHIAARGVNDSGDRFNGWKRQNFDQDSSSSSDGGTVWEHWVTTRDIRPTNRVAMSVLEAYLVLVSYLGGRFLAAVARGRRQHDHPTQLAALVKSGFLSFDEATWDITPDPIPNAAQSLLYEARPQDLLAASELLAFSGLRQHYFMFERGISEWSRAEQVKKDISI